MMKTDVRAREAGHKTTASNIKAEVKTHVGNRHSYLRKQTPPTLDNIKYLNVAQIAVAAMENFNLFPPF